MCRRIVTAERQADTEERYKGNRKVRRYRKHQQKGDEERHLDDEHRPSSEPVRKPAQCCRPDQNAEQDRRTDKSVLHRCQFEFPPDQREGDAGHEDNHAFKELAGAGQPPDTPLHAGQDGTVDIRTIAPDRCLLDIGLRTIEACN